MEALYFFDPETGACTGYAGSWEQPTDEARARIEAVKQPNQGDLAWWGESLGPAAQVAAKLDPETGGITSVAKITPPELHIIFSLAAPGTGPTGVPSVASGETATFTAEIHEDENPASAVFPFTGTIRAPYCKNGAYHGELRMEFANGVCTYVFAPQAHHHGTLTIDEKLFGLLSGYAIRVVGDATLIVDEKSAA